MKQYQCVEQINGNGRALVVTVVEVLIFEPKYDG